MDSNSIPVSSESDPALITAVRAALTSSVADAPDSKPDIQASAAAANAPEKKIEVNIPLSTEDQATGTAALADLKSAISKHIAVDLKRNIEGTSDDAKGLDSKRRQLDNKSGLLTSVQDDPQEIGAETEVKDPNWRWPAYDVVFDQLGNFSYAKRGKAPKVNPKGSPFQVIYRHARELVLWPDTVQIKLKSPHLMAILSEYMPDDKELQYLDKLDVGGRRVYDILDKLKEHKFNDGDDNSYNISAGLASVNEVSNGVHQNDNLSTDNAEVHSMHVTPQENSHGAGSTTEEARLHLHHLVRFMEEEYNVVALKYKRMKEDKCVTFDMLWAFLAPGTTVVYSCSFTQEELCATVSANDYQQTLHDGKIFSLTLNVWDYNGVAYRQCTMERVIGLFTGEKPFDNLGVRPIDMDRTTPAEVLEAEFRAKGRKFQHLAMQSNCFMYYTGPIFRVRRDEMVKEKADGRAMIDLKSFAVMNPNFPMKNAQPPLTSGSEEKDMKYSNRTKYHMELRRIRFLNMNRRGGRESMRAPHQVLAVDSQEDPCASVEKYSMTEAEEENLIFAPAIVFGFSFTLKQWGAFAVTGFSEIDFDTNAFDALVMEPEHKGLLYSLVSQFIATPNANRGPSTEITRVDPIAKKGEGCIFLCYGPPGTGKTLTAESLAENLRRPLWSLSVAELGTTPNELEKTLLRILDTAAMWKAVLLLDEADVYLEKRVAAGDLTRNAMTGVFMRLLEYYRGVLFLTTNRITTFDEAFRSRISLVLCYPKLNKERRLQIWRAALARVQAGKEEELKVGSGFLMEMARQKMNGREIRNAIYTAQTLARSKDEDLQEQHLRFVMRVITKTSDILDANLQDACL